MDKLLFYAINNKVKSILFLLFITIISLMGYKDLGVDTRLSSLLNEQDSSKKIYDKFVDEFGSEIMHLWFELRQFNVINENKIKKFILNSSTNDGINLFNKELSYIKDAMINDYLTLSFKSKLLIQDEIKGDSITISHTGPLNYVANNKFEHYTYINGNYYKNTTQNIKVLNSNGLRYINLDIIIKTPRGEDWYGHFVRHLLPKINMISFLIKSDSSNKIYNLIPSNIKNVNVKKPNYTINNISEVFWW